MEGEDIQSYAKIPGKQMGVDVVTQSNSGLLFLPKEFDFVSVT